MWLMLQQNDPDDYVLGTGEAHSVKEFVAEAFGYVNLDWQEYVKIDPRYFRPLETETLIADASKAKEKLSWEPKIRFKELGRIMVDADMETLDLTPPGKGKAILAKHGMSVIDRALIRASQERCRSELAG